MDCPSLPAAYNTKAYPCPEKLPGWPLTELSVNSPYPLARKFRGILYSLLSAPGPEMAHFAFSGKFQGLETIWDATLLSLAHYHAQQPYAGQSVMRSAFMEIGGMTACGRRICVALDIPVIDEAAILKTIIMVRNYKRLHSGHQAFGETRCFQPCAPVDGGKDESR